MSGSREVLVFDAPGAKANEAIAGLTLGGYTVLRATTVAAFEQLLATHAGHRSKSLAAVVVDFTADERAALEIVGRIAAEPLLRAVPKVHLIRPGQKPPRGELTIALKRPVATPALIRLLEHMSREASRGSAAETASVSPLVASTVPTMVGSYEILDEIASGGMGTVFLAQRSNEIGFQRLYAVKLVHPHLANDNDLHGMVLDEAAIASRIHHPNVAAVVDLGLDGGRPYVVMQYVEGCSLAQLLARRGERRRVELIVHVILDVLEGLQVAHDVADDDGRSLGIVHRDVSPDNILVGVDGVARITDFGVAKARNRLTMTQKGVHKGKLLYLAPEELLDSTEPDRRVDVFAAGVVLWHALTGKMLFHAESPAGVMRNIMEAPIPAPSTVAGSAALRPLDAVCLRALDRDPMRRYPSARAMGRALRQVASDHGLLVPPELVGAWVDDAYGEELRARRRAVRRARGTGSFPSLHARADHSTPRAPVAAQTTISSTSYSVLGSEASESRARTQVGPLQGGAPEGVTASHGLGEVSRRPRRRTPWTVVASITGVAAMLAVGVAVGTCDARPPPDTGDPAPAPPVAGSVESRPSTAPAQDDAAVREASVVAPEPPADAAGSQRSAEPPPPPPEAFEAPAAESGSLDKPSGKHASKRRRPKRRRSAPAHASPSGEADTAEASPQSEPKPAERNPIQSEPEANPYRGG